jgi:hypothetical protein
MRPEILSCPACGAPLEGKTSSIQGCPYCRSSVSSAPESQSLSQDSRADLSKHIEVLRLNLISIDPLSLWSSRPELSFGSKELIAGGSLLASGIIIAALGSAFFVLPAACGALVFGRRITRFLSLRQAYLDDMARSSGNSATAAKLRAELADCERRLSMAGK